MASESGSSTDSHAEAPENKEGETSMHSVRNKGLGTRCRCEYYRHQLIRFISRILLSPTVKKKYGAGLKFSNLMNIGKKKPSSLEIPGKCVDTSGEQRSAVHAV